MINTTSERLKARNFFNCRYFSFYEQLKFRAGVEHEKSFIASWPGLIDDYIQDDAFMEKLKSSNLATHYLGLCLVIEVWIQGCKIILHFSSHLSGACKR